MTAIGNGNARTIVKKTRKSFIAKSPVAGCEFSRVMVSVFRAVAMWRHSATLSTHDRTLVSLMKYFLALLESLYYHSCILWCSSSSAPTVKFWYIKY